MHSINYVEYPCKMSEKGILKDLNKWAFDPQQTSSYHGNMRFFKDKTFKNYDEARAWLEKNFDNHDYRDATVRYRDGHKIFWLAKVEYHC